MKPAQPPPQTPIRKASTPGPLPVPDGGGRGLEIAGVLLSLVWIGLILVYVLVLPGGGGDDRTFSLLMTLLMVFLPLALVWVALLPSNSKLNVFANSR